MAIKKAAKEVVNEVKDEALKVNADFEGEIDPYLTKWAALKYSGALACGFGVALLVIGFVVGKVF